MKTNRQVVFNRKNFRLNRGYWNKNWSDKSFVFQYPDFRPSHSLLSFASVPLIAIFIVFTSRIWLDILIGAFLVLLGLCPVVSKISKLPKFYKKLVLPKLLQSSFYSMRKAVTTVTLPIGHKRLCFIAFRCRQLEVACRRMPSPRSIKMSSPKFDLRQLPTSFSLFSKNTVIGSNRIKSHGF